MFSSKSPNWKSGEAAPTSASYSPATANVFAGTGLSVGQHHDVAHVLQLALDFLEQRHEIGVHEHDLGFRIVERVGNLLAARAARSR